MYKRQVPGNGVEFTGELLSCDVCALGKSSQKPHPKHAKNDVTQPFQLVTIGVLGELRPVALCGFKFVSKIMDQFAKWPEVFLLKAKPDVVDSLQLYNQHTVIPPGYRLGRVKRDRGGEFTGNAFRQYCREAGVKIEKLEVAVTNTSQQIGANE